jgi:hypothetical protein
MSKSQDLPHFDNEGNGNAQKVLTWLQGKAFVATQNIAKEISLELQGYRA